jgi:hypothetical protein
MKLIVTLLILFIKTLCIAQTIEDKNLSIQYKQALMKAPTIVQKFIEESYMGFISRYKIDTLNKKHFDPSKYNSILILDADTNFETKFESDAIELPMPWGAQGYISGDTLLINTGILMPGSITKIYKGKTVTVWHEYSKYDKIFRLNINHKKVNEIFVPTQKSRLTLSNLHPKVGQTLYGKLELKTAPYLIDNYNFTKGYIHQQVDIICYFHFKLRKKDW